MFRENFEKIDHVIKIKIKDGWFLCRLNSSKSKLHNLKNQKIIDQNRLLFRIVNREITYMFRAISIGTLNLNV